MNTFTLSANAKRMIYVLALLLAACGGGSGGGGGGNPPPATCTVGGTASGLSGSGLELTDNGGDRLSVAADGSFTFATALASGAAYDVAVLAQPTNPSQTCVVTGAAGNVSAANITSIVVSCVTNTYTVGVTVTGLAGSGLALRDNGGDALSITADGSFTFATALASGASYDVTVFAQPANPVQTCAAANASGTIGAANVTNVTVTCTTASFLVGGMIIGLTGSGLVLQDNGGDNLSVAAIGSFHFATPLASGATYAVTVLTQPSNPAETCGVGAGSGTVGRGNVASVEVICTPNSAGTGFWIPYLATPVPSTSGGLSQGKPETLLETIAWRRSILGR